MLDILKSPKNDIMVVMAIIMGIFLFLGITGNLDPAYHFTDDHNIVRITNELKTESIGSVMVSSIQSDLNIRFRPIFWLSSILGAKLFGINFILWSLWVAILACSTFQILHKESSLA